MDSEHAEQMRRALVDLNPDLVRRDPQWVVRIVSAEGETGKRLLEQMADTTHRTPVVATTSRMLSTGVDIEDVKYVVLFRPIGSIVEFKQIIGRGTRLYPDHDKYTFEIIDFVGVSRLFSDPGFDGAPISSSTETIDETGEIVGEQEGDPVPLQPNGDLPTSRNGARNGVERDAQPRRRKFYVDGADVTQVAEGYLVPDTSSGELRLVEYTDFVAQQVRRISPTSHDFRTRWADSVSREEIEQELAERGVSIAELAERSGLAPDTDAFDVLVHLAWDVPAKTRAERARLVQERYQSELERLVPEARSAISALLERYATYGVDEITQGAALQVPLLSDLGSPTEIAAHFGGAEAWHDFLGDVQNWLYSA